MSPCYDTEKWLMVSLASIAISLTIGLLIQVAHGQNQTTTNVNNTDLSIDVPNNWEYEEFFSTVALTPNEFGILLGNNDLMDRPLNEKIKDGGAYATFSQDWEYSIKNTGLDLYAKYKIDKQNSMKVIKQENVTIDNEPAVKIYGDGINSLNGTRFVEYMVMHDNKPYYIGYMAGVKDFEKYVPEFEQIVKTFRVIDGQKVQTFDDCINMNASSISIQTFKKTLAHMCNFLVEKNLTLGEFGNAMKNNITLAGEFLYRYGNDIQQEFENVSKNILGKPFGENIEIPLNSTSAQENIEIPLNSTSAQNFDSNSNYLDFSSYSVGNIKYPSDWVYNEYTTYGRDQFALFIPSSEVSLNQSITNQSDLAASVSIGQKLDLPYQNMPLDLYFEYAKKLRLDNGDNITNTGKTKLSDGSPAYEIDFTPKNNTRKSVLVIMNKNAESYYFQYTALPDKFNTYLPIAQQMFKTLSIGN